jgi:hypothetical protein
MKVDYVSYDFMDNGNGDLLMAMDKPEGTADDEAAKFVYDGAKEAMLIRNSEQIIHLPLIDEAMRPTLEKIDTILVVEMDGNDIDDSYMAKVEIINKPLPIPRDVDYE